MKQIDFNDAYGQRHVLNLSDYGFDKLLSQMRETLKAKEEKDNSFDNPEGGKLLYDTEWIGADLIEGFSTFESRIRVDIDKNLTPEEIDQVCGAIGYSARVNLRGEGLGEPEVTHRYAFGRDWTILCFHYDLTKSSSDDVSAHFDQFQSDMEAYIRNGSPAYKQAKNGHPKGFQLVKGIGNCDIDLFTD